MASGRFGKEESPYRRGSSASKTYRSNEFICPLCKGEFVDPRVLPCLHSFCIECLKKLELEQNARKATTKRPRNERLQGLFAGYFSKSTSGRGEYLKLGATSEGDDRDGISKGAAKRLRCPTCAFENGIPESGVQELHPNYLLQHRMLIESLKRGEICLLCDLCSSEIPATSRCTRCLLNLCDNCSKSHKREKLFPDHELTKLKKNRGEGVRITRIRRQAMCHAHPDKELRFYCSTCHQVACIECRLEFHSNHDYESFSRAAQLYATRIQESLEKTRSFSRDVSTTVARLNRLSKQIESKYSQVQREVNKYVDSCVDAYEEHRRALLLQATQIKNGQLQKVRAQRSEIQRKIDDAGYSIRFGEELLTEGSDFEVLSFALCVLQKLDWCVRTGKSALSSALASCIGALQFLPEERAGAIRNRIVYGVVTTQVVSPSHCHITPEGLDALKNCREHERCDLTLVTKDNFNQRLVHGAEGISVDLKSRGGVHRETPVCVVDQQNGVYIISFTPNCSGKMSLTVSIRGIQIKGSPFTVNVKPERVHKGTFHCCAFCSSGGNKNAVCACGGRMPGGYQGCGHGYTGHPGGRHWSCCGNTMQKSECLGSLQKNGFYQLSL